MHTQYKGDVRRLVYESSVNSCFLRSSVSMVHECTTSRECSAEGSLPARARVEAGAGEGASAGGGDSCSRSRSTSRRRARRRLNSANCRPSRSSSTSGRRRAPALPQPHCSSDSSASHSSSTSLISANVTGVVRCLTRASPPRRRRPRTSAEGAPGYTVSISGAAQAHPPLTDCLIRCIVWCERVSVMHKTVYSTAAPRCCMRGAGGDRGTRSTQRRVL